MTDVGIPIESISFTSNKGIYSSWVSMAEGKETQQLLQSGIIHYGLRLSGEEEGR